MRLYSINNKFYNINDTVDIQTDGQEVYIFQHNQKVQIHLELITIKEIVDKMKEHEYNKEIEDILKEQEHEN